MKRRTRRVAYGVSEGAIAAVSVLGAGAAQAAKLYDNTNYGGYMETRTSGTVGAGFNDRTTSIRNTGAEKYCENSGCSGRSVWLTGDYNDLRAVNTGLGWGETW